VLFIKKRCVFTSLLLFYSLSVFAFFHIEPHILEAATPKVTVDWLIEPQFNQANDFACGVAWVQEESGGLWKQIDREGNVLIDNYKADLITIYDTKTKTAVFWNSQDLAGYINLSGDAVIAPQYERAWKFEERVALVRQRKGDSSSLGVIDCEGNIVLPITYEFLRIISSDLFATRQGKEWRFINAEGNVTARFVVEGMRVPDYLRDVFPVLLDKKMGLVNAGGEWVLPASFDKVYMGRDELIGLEKDGKVGFVDATGRTIIDFRFQGMFDNDTKYYYAFSEGLAVILFTNLPPPPSPEELTLENIVSGAAWSFKIEDVKSGVIDTSGKLLFEFRGMPLTLFSGGLLLVQTSEDRYGLIDREGNLHLLPQNVEFDLFLPKSLEERILRVQTKDKKARFGIDLHGYLKINVK